MELNKLKDTIKHLDDAIAKVASAKTSSEVNAADNEIGACLRSIQYGVGMVGIECKHMVENKQKALRGIAFVAPAPDPVVSKTEQRKEEVAEKETKKKRTKKAKK